MLKLTKIISNFRAFAHDNKDNPNPTSAQVGSLTGPLSSLKADSIFTPPICKRYSFKIRGEEFHAVDIKLACGQSINARAGSLSYMDHNVNYSTQLHGGIASSLSRSVAGSSICLIKYWNPAEDEALLMLSPAYPSKIIPIDLDLYKGKLLCHRDSYLCGDTDISVTARYMPNPVFGLWGGLGFAFQQLEGSGVALISGGGVIIKKTLKDDEEIRVTPGNILAFDSRIQFKMIAVSGFRNIMFGHGMFFLMFKGPGDVFLQTMPFQKIANGMFESLTKNVQKKG